MGYGYHMVSIPIPGSHDSTVLNFVLNPFFNRQILHLTIKSHEISVQKIQQKSHEIPNNKLLNGILMWDFHDKSLIIFNDF
jgi:hypothetical protein